MSMSSELTNETLQELLSTLSYTSNHPLLDQILNEPVPKPEITTFTLGEFEIEYLTDLETANTSLATIVEGDTISIDTEYDPVKVNELGPQQKEVAKVLAITNRTTHQLRTVFKLEFWLGKDDPSSWVDFANMGLCLVAIGCPKDKKVRVLDMHLIKAYPREFGRIAASKYIHKIGHAVTNEVSIIFSEVGTPIRNLSNVGYMARLRYADADVHPRPMSLSLMSLQDCVQKVLLKNLDKELQTSDWNGTLSEAQIAYSAMDAVAILQVYEPLNRGLQALRLKYGCSIPTSWYEMTSEWGVLFQKTSDGERGGLFKPDECVWFKLGKFYF